jgi:hypothetical protein
MTSPATKSVKSAAATKDVNKSEEIRKIATAIKAEGKKPRPILIIEALKKRGITVSSPQVSMVLKRMGFRPRKRRSSGEVAAKGRSTRVLAISVDDLVAAKKLVAHFGGINRALQAIEALRRLEG